MALQDTDLLLVQRGTQSYKLTGANAKSDLGGDLQAVTDRGNTTTVGIKANKTGTGVVDVGGASTVWGLQVSDDSGTRTSGVQYDGSAVLAGGSIALENNGENRGTFWVRNDVGNDAYVVYKDGTAQQNKTVQIKGDGSATFAGYVTSTSANDTYSFGIKNGNTNIGGLYRSGTEDTRLILKNNTGITVDLKGADGSAEFTSTVKTEGDASYFTVNRTSTTASSALYLGFADGTEVFKVGTDGSATFADVVTGLAFVGTGVTWLSGTGLTNATAPNTFVVKAYNSDTATNTVEIKGDGSANFAGTVQVGGNPNTGTAAGFSVTNLGLIRAARTNGTDPVFNAYTVGSSNTTVSINADGSASFAGQVWSGGNPFDGATTATKLTDSGVVVASASLATNNVWLGYTTGTSTPTSEIKADGSATFAARVSGSVVAVTSSGNIDLGESNYWRVDGPGLNNPSNATAGQSGVIYCVGEVNSFGNQYSFPGGETPTIPANSVVPYFVDTDNKIRIGIATEAFV